MKRISVLMLIAIIAVTGTAFSQSKKNSVEVLYFKAKQCGCKGRACNALENNVKALIEENFPDEDIVFKHIWLNEKENTDLIKKYNAKAQTVVMVKTRRKKEWVTDLTDVVKRVNVRSQAETAKAELIAQIKQNL